MSVFLCCHKEREARSSQQGELRMKRPGIMTISLALAMGLATTAWAAEGAAAELRGVLLEPVAWSLEAGWEAAV